jgi:Zn-finger nucleic acid-binding protein
MNMNVLRRITMIETVACMDCGTANMVTAHFCIECGASLLPATTGPTARLAPLQQSHAQSDARQLQGGGSMYCPVCREVALVMADRQGIEVDYCPQCRGVWLDRGELDKIIERVALTQGGATPQTPQPRDRSPSEYRQYRDHDDDYRRKKKRRGLLDELFDFD